MLREKCSNGNDIETRKNAKNKEKKRTKVCNLKNKKKAKLPAANADI